ncbi:MAG: 8-amino-7-oxononanoate synthase, partial [Nocardioidaceae bacterium]
MSLERWLATRAAERRAAGLERRLRPQASRTDLVDLAGNDYLGLRTDPRVTSAAAKAAQEWGAGAGASRLVTGTLHLHETLEHALAYFTGNEAALVFATGYQANLGAVTGLTDAETLIVSDAHVHASLVDACRLARLARLVVTPHNDVAAVEATLRQRDEPRALVLVESVYSVLGDTAPVGALGRLAERYDAVLVADEAHAMGVSGSTGRGLIHANGLSGRPGIVTTMTLSKALGGQGGAVLGTKAVMEHLVNTARPFIFDTGLAPPLAGAALEALRIVSAEPGLAHRARSTAREMAAAAGQSEPGAAVLSIPMSSPEEAVRAQQALAKDGFLVWCFRPPSVPAGVSRLRIT